MKTQKPNLRTLALNLQRTINVYEDELDVRAKSMALEECKKAAREVYKNEDELTRLQLREFCAAPAPTEEMIKWVLELIVSIDLGAEIAEEGEAVADEIELDASPESAARPREGMRIGPGDHVFFNSTPIPLPPLDARLLIFLMRQPGGCSPIEMVMREVWGNDGATDSALKNAQSRVNKQLVNASAGYSICKKAGLVRLERF